MIEKIKGCGGAFDPGGWALSRSTRARRWTICERVEPNIIIPMHFKTPATDMDIAPLHEFLDAAGREYDVSHPGQCYLKIDHCLAEKADAGSS